MIWDSCEQYVLPDRQCLDILLTKNAIKFILFSLYCLEYFCMQNNALLTASLYPQSAASLPVVSASLNNGEQEKRESLPP